jgi:hypothetical protein
MSRPLTELQVARIKRMRADGHTLTETAGPGLFAVDRPEARPGSSGEGAERPAP